MSVSLNPILSDVELSAAGANPAYATELSRLVAALQFDPSYVEEIAAFGEVS